MGRFVTSRKVSAWILSAMVSGARVCTVRVVKLSDSDKVVDVVAKDEGRGRRQGM